MIIQNIYLNNWDWKCKIYYAVDDYYAEDIIKDVINIGCHGEDLANIKDLVYNYKKNTGFTYTSKAYRASVMIIGLTTSSDEFQNTYDHEKGHLAAHISLALNIDPYSEEYQYLNGDIGIQTFRVAKNFLCECCRKKLYKH